MWSEVNGEISTHGSFEDVEFNSYLSKRDGAYESDDATSNEGYAEVFLRAHILLPLVR